MSRTTRRLPEQAILLVVAGLVWMLAPRPLFAWWVGAYGVAWIGWNLVRRRARGWDFQAPAVWFILALLVALPLTQAVRSRAELVRGEGWAGAAQGLRDRLRQEQPISIAPPVLFADQPQDLYIRAKGASRVQLTLPGVGSALHAESLGHSLFRVHYNPKVHGAPTLDSARIRAVVTADERPSELDLRLEKPEAHPRWFSSAPELGLAATTSEETDEVFVVGRDRLQTLATHDGPSDVALLADQQRIAVAHRYDSRLSFLSLADATPIDVEVGLFQHRLTAASDGSALAVARRALQPEVVVVDPTTARVRERFVLEEAPDWIVFGSSADELVVSSLAKRSLTRYSRDKTGEWRSNGTLLLGRPAVTLARDNNGETLYVATTDYRPDGDPHRGNHFVQDQILVVDLVDWRIEDRIFTPRRSPRQGRAGNIDRGVSPMGLAARSDGTLLVAFAGTDEVWVLDPSRHQPLLMVAEEFHLVAPHGVADLGGGAWAASSPAGGAIATFDAEGHELYFFGVAPSDKELAAGAEGSLARHNLSLRAGERAFYESTRAGISCQSCHLHGGSDEVPHNIGQRPLLPTLTTRGVAGTAPYLRDASFPRIRDLHPGLAVRLYRGYLRSVPRREVALENYVESLPRETNPSSLHERDLPLERAGLDAFVAARCDLCHTPPLFTNLSQHPVRTLFPAYGKEQLVTSQVDTPALLNSHARTHFLQDGRAHDLEEVMVHFNKANRHGDTASLSEEQRQALAHFLLAL